LIEIVISALIYAISKDHVPPFLGSKQLTEGDIFPVMSCSSHPGEGHPVTSLPGACSVHHKPVYFITDCHSKWVWAKEEAGFTHCSHKP